MGRGARTSQSLPWDSFTFSGKLERNILRSLELFACLMLAGNPQKQKDIAGELHTSLPMGYLDPSSPSLLLPWPWAEGRENVDREGTAQVEKVPSMLQTLTPATERTKILPATHRLAGT